jgi:GWxTD domain-containing protein
MLIRGERGRVMWNDTVRVMPRGALRSDVVEVPVARLGIGVGQLTFVRDGGSDSSSTYVFVGFGGDLPVATYDDMLNYLRWFAQPARIQRLRDAAEEDRPAAWSAFVRETDDQPETAIHETLREYFGRLVRANGRFREEATPGWMSDRGRVFITLGEPDQLLEPTLNDFSRGRQQLWDYRSLNLQLVFYDQTGTGRWRLTQSSEVRFESEFRRRLR